jgi:hypothetical protein
VITRRHIFVLLALTLTSQSIMAAWSLEPSYYLRYERNDNIYLATQDNELAVTGGTFSPAIRAIMEEEDQSLATDVSLQFTRYQDHEELDRDEGRAGLNWRKATELSMYGVNAGYSSKSNLDSSLETSGIDQKVDTKKGNISPNWKYQLGERWNVSVNLSYSDVTYDEPGLPGALNFKVVNFVNYTDASINLDFILSLSEQDSVNFSYYQSRYEGISNGLQFSRYISGLLQTYLEASERKVDYDYQVMQLGYVHQFNESQNVKIQVGANETNTQKQTRLYLFDQSENVSNIGSWIQSDTKNTGQVYNIAYNQKNEISRLELSAGRNRVAASTGGLDETDTAKIFYTGNITERFSWSLDINRANYQPDRDISVQSVTEYTRISASPSLSYAIDKDWSMSMGYRYSEKDIDTDELSRKSSMVFFNMSWREPKLLSTN